MRFNLNNCEWTTNVKDKKWILCIYAEDSVPFSNIMRSFFRSLLIWQWQSIFAIILIKISIIFSTSTSAFNLTILYFIYMRNKHLISINTPTVCSINRLPFKVFSGGRRTTTWKWGKCLRYYSENCAIVLVLRKTRRKGK